jgi:hypothetical protein
MYSGFLFGLSSTVAQLAWYYHVAGIGEGWMQIVIAICIAAAIFLAIEPDMIVMWVVVTACGFALVMAFSPEASVIHRRGPLGGGESLEDL